MAPWTHLIRFVAKEDHAVHLGQLVHTSRDVGKDATEGIEIKAYLINGTIFQGNVTGVVYTVERVCIKHPRHSRHVSNANSFCHLSLNRIVPTSAV